MPDFGSPVAILLRAGSRHLGNPQGVLAAMSGESERLDYLSSLDQATARLLAPALGASLRGHVRPGVDPVHVAELFLIVNAQINRRVLTGLWDRESAMDFAATALQALAPLLRDPGELGVLIAQFQQGATR